MKNIHKITFWVLLVAFLGGILPPSSLEKAFATATVTVDNASVGPIKPPSIVPSNPAVEQKLIIEGETDSEANPGVYLYQSDNGKWHADTYRGDVTVDNIGSNDDPWPAIETYTNKIDMNQSAYLPSSGFLLNDGSNIKKPLSEMQNFKIVKATDDTFNEDKTSNTISLQILNNTFVLIESETGRKSDLKYIYFKRIEYDKRLHTNYPKMNMGYYTSIALTWRGQWIEKKKIQLTGQTTMKVGDQQNLTAEVATGPPPTNTYGSPVDVTARAETTWELVSGSDVIDLLGQGKVIAKKKGTAKVKVTWTKDLYTLTTSINIGVDETPNPVCLPGDVNCNGGGNGPGVSCTDPSPSGTEVSDSYIDPVATAVIKADNRGSEQFDVGLGIPTSESLYGNVLARNYLYKDNFVQMEGTCTFTVPVTKTYTLKWDPTKTITGPDGKPQTVPDPQTDTQEVTKEVTIERPYSFWKINELQVNKIDEASLVNYALPNGGIVLTPSGYSPPYYSASTNGGLVTPDNVEVTAPPETKTGGTSRPDITDEDFTPYAEPKVPKVKVNNDTLNFNGTTIMNGSTSDQDGPTPSQIPAPSQLGQNVLYSPGNIISSSKVNKKDTPSSGTISYGLMSGNINGGSDQTFPIYNINTVTVHTPVVTYASVSDDQPHNQKTKPNMNRSALILDRPFTVRIPTSGQHTNYPGYGNRDYAKYVQTKQVYFPFDVYNETRTQFIPKNTWIDIPVGQLDTTFYLPVWVDEGDYQVYFRTIAENAPTGFTTQPDANLNLANHVSTDEVSVEVIGRVYDFHITDIADYNWETVFRTSKGSSTPTGNSYWTGLNGIDGVPRGNTTPFTLPIRPGSHPQQGFKNVAIKTGYHFKFDLKTKGNMFEKNDSIRITPSFYYVSRDGKTRRAVDLYYHSSTQNFVKIGSKEDKVQRYVILNERLRNVPKVELTDTAQYKYDHYPVVGYLNRSQFVNEFKNKIAREKTIIGSYSAIMLPEQIRTFIGPKTNIPTGVDPDRALASIQKWYGEYSLPADVYAVAAGTNLAEYGRTNGGLDDKSPIFLKNGYIIVNFNIETVQNGDVTDPHLQYIHAQLMNQWKMEGFKRTIQDSFGNTFNLLDGDVVFYHADKSSRDDFSSQVPH